jgi:hypothetical protein
VEFVSKKGGKGASRYPSATPRSPPHVDLQWLLLFADNIFAQATDKEYHFDDFNGASNYLLPIKYAPI